MLLIHKSSADDKMNKNRETQNSENKNGMETGF
jgi:hypothetical protein